MTTVIVDHQPSRVIVYHAIPTVSLVDSPETLEVRIQHTSIEVTGPMGPAGPQGPPGVSSPTHRYVQVTPAATWLIDHSLTYLPSVTCVDVSGNSIRGEVDYGPSRVTVSFSEPVAGEASLS